MLSNPRGGGKYMRIILGSCELRLVACIASPRGHSSAWRVAFRSWGTSQVLSGALLEGQGSGLTIDTTASADSTGLRIVVVPVAVCDDYASISCCGQATTAVAGVGLESDKTQCDGAADGCCKDAAASKKAWISL